MRWSCSFFQVGRLIALMACVACPAANAAETASQHQHLDHFVKSCTSKQWAACNLARYDLIKKAGFKLEVSEHGDPYLMPPSKQAAKLYFDTLDKLTDKANPNDLESLHGVIRPMPPIPDEIPEMVAMFFDVRNYGMRGVGLIVIAHNFRQAGIDYDVMEEIDDPRLEFIRQLALAYTVRGTQIEAKRALNQLKMAARTAMERRSAAATNLACKTYLGSKKATNIQEQTQQ